MTAPFFTSLARTFTGVSIPQMTNILKDTFKIHVVEINKNDLVKMPNFSVVDWKTPVYMEDVVKTFHTPQSDMIKLGRELLSHNAKSTAAIAGQKGVVYILRRQDGEHAYAFVGETCDLPPDHNQKPYDPDGMGKVVRCFPTFQAELVNMLSVRREPMSILEQVFGVSTPAPNKKLITYRDTPWREGANLGPFIQLGLSSVIHVSLATSAFDEGSQLIVEAGTFETTDFHVFDGRLTWIKVVDLANNKMLFATIGGGRHPFPEMDALNPFAGAAIMSTTARTYQVVLNKKIDLATITRDELDAIIAKVDPDLALLRQRFQQLDRRGINLALERFKSTPFVAITENKS